MIDNNKDDISVETEKKALIKDNYNIYLFIVAGFLILLDQITKIYIKGFNLFGVEHEGFYKYDTINTFINNIVIITFVENPGMAWGIEFGPLKFILSLFSFVAGGAIIYYLIKIVGHHLGVRIGFTLILSGALGNGIDRVFYGWFYGYEILFYGYVVDFIQVDIPDIFGMTHWPVFNIADASVSCGVVLLLIFNKKIPTLEVAFPKFFKKDNEKVAKIDYENEFDDNNKKIGTTN